MSEIEFRTDSSVRLIQSMGGDHMVVAAAKVSTNGEEAVKFADESAEGKYGLINYLMKQRHGSPFEHSCLTFFVSSPVFVFREWHRHRIGFSYNESSARYSEFKPIFWLPRPSRPMKPVTGYKPSRPQFEPVDEAVYTALVARMKKLYTAAYETYQESIKDGIANEVARAVLPVGIYSSCWVTVNPRSLMHFLSLRVHDPNAKFVSYPQLEIEEAARVCESLFAQGWPLTYKAFIENGRVSP